MKLTETQLVRQILDYLALRKIFAFRVNTMGVPTWRNGKIDGFRPAPTTGVSDILGVMPNGRFLAIEAKVGSNKPSPNQEQFLANVRKSKGIALVVYDLDGVIAGLSPISKQKG